MWKYVKNEGVGDDLKNCKVSIRDPEVKALRCGDRMEEAITGGRCEDNTGSRGGWNRGLFNSRWKSIEGRPHDR